MVYATSKIDAGKVNSPLHLRLKLDAVFKKQSARKVSIHLQDNRLIDILEQYEIISPMKKRLTKRKHTHRTSCYPR